MIIDIITSDTFGADYTFGAHCTSWYLFKGSRNVLHKPGPILG